MTVFKIKDETQGTVVSVVHLGCGAAEETIAASTDTKHKWPSQSNDRAAFTAPRKTVAVTSREPRASLAFPESRN